MPATAQNPNYVAYPKTLHMRGPGGGVICKTVNDEGQHAELVANSGENVWFENPDLKHEAQPAPPAAVADFESTIALQKSQLDVKDEALRAIAAQAAALQKQLDDLKASGNKASK